MCRIIAVTVFMSWQSSPLRIGLVMKTKTSELEERDGDLFFMSRYSLDVGLADRKAIVES